MRSQSPRTSRSRKRSTHLGNPNALGKVPTTLIVFGYPVEVTPRPTGSGRITPGRSGLPDFPPIRPIIPCVVGPILRTGWRPTNPAIAVCRERSIGGGEDTALPGSPAERSGMDSRAAGPLPGIAWVDASPSSSEEVFESIARWSNRSGLLTRFFRSGVPCPLPASRSPTTCISVSISTWPAWDGSQLSSPELPGALRTHAGRNR